MIKFDTMNTFTDLKIGDVCYSVNINGIYECHITAIDCTSYDKKKHFVKCDWFSDDRFVIQEESHIAKDVDKYADYVIYSDILPAKEKLYELRNARLTSLHTEMINAINKYEDACKVLRVYSDCTLPDDVEI